VTVPAELGAAGAMPDGTMAISVFDLFKIGIGPSSSHTVGPMRAAAMFARSLESDGLAERVATLRVELFGSLGATGHGHGSLPAVVLGLLGEDPETVDPSATAAIVDRVRQRGKLTLGGSASVAGAREIDFDVDNDIVLHRRKRLPCHSNAMVFTTPRALS
jgi:L-serine dehydratase